MLDNMIEFGKDHLQPTMLRTMKVHTQKSILVIMLRTMLHNINNNGLVFTKEDLQDNIQPTMLRIMLHNMRKYG